MKKCTKCLVEKPETEFGKRAASKDGLKYICKDCDMDWRPGKHAPARYGISPEKYIELRKLPCAICGLRAVSDFEYEFQMAGMNRILHLDVETLFLTPGEQYKFISATMVREIASLGGDVTPFVSPVGGERLRRFRAAGNNNNK